MASALTQRRQKRREAYTAPERMAAVETALDGHVDECGERYKEVARQFELITKQISDGFGSVNAAQEGAAAAVKEQTDAIHLRISNSNNARVTLVYSAGSALIVGLVAAVCYLLIHGTPYPVREEVAPYAAPTHPQHYEAPQQ